MYARILCFLSLYYVVNIFAHKEDFRLFTNCQKYHLLQNEFDQNFADAIKDENLINYLHSVNRFILKHTNKEEACLAAKRMLDVLWQACSKVTSEKREPCLIETLNELVQ